MKKTDEQDLSKLSLGDLVKKKNDLARDIVTYKVSMGASEMNYQILRKSFRVVSRCIALKVKER